MTYLPAPRPTTPPRVRIGRLMAAIATGGLLVTPDVLKYYRENNGELTIPPELAEVVVKLLSTPPRERSGSFSPSARGNCMRAQTLGFLGAPQGQISAELYNLFNDGRFRHLRWQLLGLTAGFLEEVEVSVPMPSWMAKGSVDGVNRTRKFGFELKGTSMPLGSLYNAFQHIQAALTEQKAPYRLAPTNGQGAKGVWHIGLMWKHVHQIYSYMVQLRANGYDIEKFSLVYEHKESQEWAEFVLLPNAWMEDLVQAELEDLAGTAKLRRLPPILDECATTPDKKCPYAAVCHHPHEHLPVKWQQYMKEPVRLVIKRKNRQIPQAEPARKKRRVRFYPPEAF